MDVRSPLEFEAGTIPNAMNIELDELRNDFDKLPKDKTIYLFCEVGLRGYLTTRILFQNGFEVKNLSGGYRFWKNTYGVPLNKLEKVLMNTWKKSTAIGFPYCGLLNRICISKK